MNLLFFNLFTLQTIVITLDFVIYTQTGPGNIHTGTTLDLIIGLRNRYVGVWVSTHQNQPICDYSYLFDLLPLKLRNTPRLGLCFRLRCLSLFTFPERLLNAYWVRLIAMKTPVVFNI